MATFSGKAHQFGSDEKIELIETKFVKAAFELEDDLTGEENYELALAAVAAQLGVSEGQLEYHDTIQGGTVATFIWEVRA